MRRMKPLADLVREYMEREDITATEMGRRCGVSRQNVENLVSGKVRRISWLPALADEMKTTVDALLTGKPTPSRFVVRTGPWPMEFLTRETWARLTPAQRAVVDHAAMLAAQQFIPKADDTGSRQTGT